MFVCFYQAILQISVFVLRGRFLLRTRWLDRNCYETLGSMLEKRVEVRQKKKRKKIYDQPTDNQLMIIQHRGFANS